MKTVSLSGSLRENVGKKDAKKLRKNELVPCVMYGGKEQLHLSVLEKDLSKVLFTNEIFFINIEIDKEEHKCILQDVQFHPVTDKVLHADFLLLDDKKEIVMGVPLELTGSSPGIKIGGRLVKIYRKLRILALPQNMPSKIEVDISELNINDSIRLKEIVSDKYKFIDNLESLVVAVKTARVILDEEEEGEEGEGEGEGEETEGDEKPDAEKTEAKENKE